MSVQHEEKNDNYYSELKAPRSINRRVDVNDLVSKMNEDKKKTERIALF